MRGYGTSDHLFRVWGWGRERGGGETHTILSITMMIAWRYTYINPIATAAIIPNVDAKMIAAASST